MLAGDILMAYTMYVSFLINLLSGEVLFVSKSLVPSFMPIIVKLRLKTLMFHPFKHLEDFSDWLILCVITCNSSEPGIPGNQQPRASEPI